MERLAKKEDCGSSRNSNTVCWQCWSPRYNVSVLLPCGRCHPEELIVVKSKTLEAMRKNFQKEKK